MEDLSSGPLTRMDAAPVVTGIVCPIILGLHNVVTFSDLLTFGYLSVVIVSWASRSILPHQRSTDQQRLKMHF